MSKLNLDFELVKVARRTARGIAEDIQQFIDAHTTVAVERTVLRLMGIDGVDAEGVPLPNIVAEKLFNDGLISEGAATAVARAMATLNMNAQEVAEGVSRGTVDFKRLPHVEESKECIVLAECTSNALNVIKANRRKREKLIAQYNEKDTPLLYAIVATGNIHEDITQAVACASAGADIIAVIRTTGQSLLDYVPYGITTEGFGGTYATQANFRMMRAALDEAGAKLGKYIRLCNYCSGLCMPEIAAMGAIERLDVMLNDALYGILFRDINMKRTIVDQYFSRVINGYSGIIINTGEDNYLTTADAVTEAHTVLASQLMNEQFAVLAGIPENQMGLGHAFEISPEVKNGFLLELAQAQTAREIFPNAPLKYMPPTKFMTGDIFMGNVQDALFNVVSVTTRQGIHLLGMLTEAIHTPFMSDRTIAVENAKYIFNTMHDLADEIEFKKDGIIQTRAAEVLGKAADLLDKIRSIGLFSALEKGLFADIKRRPNGGKGLEGVIMKRGNYKNPFLEEMIKSK